MALNLKEQTPAQFSTRFWRRVQAAQDSGNKVEVSRLIWWLYNRIQTGDITSLQARTSYNTHFGRALTSTQWNTLMTTRFATMRDRYQALIDEVDV